MSRITDLRNQILKAKHAYYYSNEPVGEFPASKPESPILWVIPSGGLESGKFPFGDIARIGGY